ncbi:hypothetical protein GCM10010446_67020 [Streptomyces enissocaesilis]|uniref:Uncharacterized protein n=2 Tax=Streptomyces enissocaesilis TaxID=332589 RepID=A0ABN3XPY2_9ACTN
MEQGAEPAGFSRALPRRHFLGKRERFAALYEQVSGQLLAKSRADPSEALVEQLTEDLDAHIEYFAENHNTVLATNRVPAGDRVIQTVISDEPDALRERLLGALPVSQGHVRTAVPAVLKGRLVFVQVLCLTGSSTRTARARNSRTSVPAPSWTPCARSPTRTPPLTGRLGPHSRPEGAPRQRVIPALRYGAGLFGRMSAP